MLGFGHNAEFLEKAVSAPQCMANIMTPSFSQHAFHQEFVKHVGFTRKTGNPYSRVFAMNSGSEAVELSARLTDTHAKLMTDAGAVHEGRRSTIMVLEGSFYGRTCVDDDRQTLFFPHSSHTLTVIARRDSATAAEKRTRSTWRASSTQTAISRSWSFPTTLTLSKPHLKPRRNTRCMLKRCIWNR